MTGVEQRRTLPQLPLPPCYLLSSSNTAFILSKYLKWTKVIGNYMTLMYQLPMFKNEPLDL